MEDKESLTFGSEAREATDCHHQSYGQTDDETSVLATGHRDQWAPALGLSQGLPGAALAIHSGANPILLRMSTQLDGPVLYLGVRRVYMLVSACLLLQVQVQRD